MTYKCLLLEHFCFVKTFKSRKFFPTATWLGSLSTLNYLPPFVFTVQGSVSAYKEKTRIITPHFSSPTERLFRTAPLRLPSNSHHTHESWFPIMEPIINECQTIDSSPSRLFFLFSFPLFDQTVRRVQSSASKKEDDSAATAISADGNGGGSLDDNGAFRTHLILSSFFTHKLDQANVFTCSVFHKPRRFPARALTKFSCAVILETFDF